MFRSYEDPRKLERLLEEAERAYEEARSRDEDGEDEYQWVEEIKERINFAWQDDEFDCLSLYD